MNYCVGCTTLNISAKHSQLTHTCTCTTDVLVLHAYNFNFPSFYNTCFSVRIFFAMQHTPTAHKGARLKFNINCKCYCKISHTTAKRCGPVHTLIFKCCRRDHFTSLAKKVELTPTKLKGTLQDWCCIYPPERGITVRALLAQISVNVCLLDHSTSIETK